MKIAAIICEYDPFHNGHTHHIAQTRAAGAETVICIMSGN
ncbi:MAG: nucleotidyltransferase family protein, partial [Clostridia bacterium]|nr:nucleotidyltransferase family protein [Clostridia bacterium]